MNYIVIDLEWNQCQAGKKSVTNLPVEIIEIGAVMLNEKLNIVSSFDHYVKPQVYTEINEYIKSIVNIDMDKIKQAKPFEEVYSRFVEWCGKEPVFCTWGMSDLIELQRNVTYYGMQNIYDRPFEYYDIQKLFSISKDDGKIRRNLSDAVEMLGIKVAKDFHNALNDAHYTAMVCQKIDFENLRKWYSIDTYNIPRNKAEEITAEYETYEKFISRGYKYKEDILRDKRVFSKCCYLCDENLTEELGWFANANKMYYYLGKCKNHGYIKGRLRIKKADNSKYYAIRILKQTDEAGAKKVIAKKHDKTKQTKKS